MSSAKLSHKHNPERLLAFQDEEFVDCTFKIDGQEIKAHKAILASSSPVFEKMFFGDLASNEIIIGDIKAEELRQVLEFIYTGNVQFSSIFNAWSLCYIARKYILDDLFQHCLAYISQNLTVSTLVLSYEYSELYNAEKLRNECFCDIIEVINGVFVNDYHMKPSTLRNVLKEDLIINTTDLIWKIFEWAANECELRGLISIPENITHILRQEDILPYINKKRLLFMTCENCNFCMTMCQCLDKPISKTLIYLCNQVIWEEEPKIERFVNVAPRICKMRKIYKIACRIDLQHSEEFLSSVSVNTEVMVLGMVLCTEMNCSNDSSEQYEGRITIKFCEENSCFNIVKPTIINNVFAYSSEIYIPLRFVITLNPDKIYDIKISYQNFSSKRPSSIVCSYMSDDLVDKMKGCSKMFFFDFSGSIIKGVAYYPS